MSEEVDAMLEAAYSDKEEEEIKSRDSRSPDRERSSKKKKKHRRRSRSRSHSKSRSRSRSRSRDRKRPRSRDSFRDRGRDHKSGRRHHRSRSRSRSRDRHHRHGDRDRPSFPRSRYSARFGSDNRDRRFRQSRSSSLDRRMKLSPSPDRRNDGPELSEEEKDKRTVFCMQLARTVTGKDLEAFVAPAGKIRNVKMITDKNSRRPKGIAYVEFVEVDSVGLALKLNGQKLFGVPIMIQPTMAEKNRAAANAENLKKAEGPRKLYIGNLHPNINEIMLKAIFEPFGKIDVVKVQKEKDGTSKGYGFVEFKSSDMADNAMKQLNGFELAGQPIRVNYVNEKSDAMESLDNEDIDIGIGMSSSSRASLMAKLSEGHNAGLKPPGIQNIAAVASCLVLKNMFDPNKQIGVGWTQEIRDDVIGEAGKFGYVYHIHVDATAPDGSVYVKCQSPQVASAVVNALSGRKYAGSIIAAQLMPESNYHGIFPMAMTASMPLLSSTM